MAKNTVTSSFDSLHRTHYAEVHRFVFRFVQDADLADELTQNAFLRAYEGTGSFHGEAPERIWLLRVARRVCLDYVRSPRSRARAAASLDQARARGRELDSRGITITEKEPPPTVEEAPRQVEMSECVQQFVMSLSETLRTPLVLHDMQGFTNAEIAQVMDCSVEAAKMCLHRARTQLWKVMDENCDLFHDERNVFSCLPVAPDRAREASEGFVALDEISAP
jgi:RNA polymerase sigma-70 factor (ECF subfamily)